MMWAGAILPTRPAPDPSYRILKHEGNESMTTVSRASIPLHRRPVSPALRPGIGELYASGSWSRRTITSTPGSRSSATLPPRGPSRGCCVPSIRRTGPRRRRSSRPPWSPSLTTIRPGTIWTSISTSRASWRPRWWVSTTQTARSCRPARCSCRPELDDLERDPEPEAVGPLLLRWLNPPRPIRSGHLRFGGTRARGPD